MCITVGGVQRFTLWGHVKSVSKHAGMVRRPRIGMAVILASFAINLLGLALPLVVLQVFDRVIPFQSRDTLMVLFIGLCVATALDFSFKWARIVLLGHAGEEFEIALGQKFLRKTLNAVPAAFEKKTLGAHYERLGAVAQLRDYYAGQGRLMAVDLPFTGIFVGLIWLIGGWLVVVPVSGFVILLIFKVMLQHVQGPIFEDRKTLDGRRYSFLIEFLSQIITVKSQTMEPQMLRRYELLQQQSVGISRKLIYNAGLSQSFGAIFSQAAVAAMGLLGAYLVITRAIGVAELAACMLLNGRTVQPLLKMLSFWAQAENVTAAHSKIAELGALPQREFPTFDPDDLQGAVRFGAVSLGHPTRDSYLFENVSFALSPGQFLALAGSDGAGKSSFLRLVLGEQTPTAGDVEIDGFAATHFAECRGAGGICYVDQNPAIFAGTILENISLFGSGSSATQALNAAAEIGLERDIHRMPMGYETRIGTGQPGAVNQGLLQRICLARAIALRPKILLLNDPTTAMDARTIRQFADVLADRHSPMTVIAATRNKALLALADQTVVLGRRADAQIQQWDNDREIDKIAVTAQERTG